MTSSEWLLRNAILQVAFSIFLGWLMLLPRQKRGGGALAVLLTKDFTAAHLDWLMLAFMQFGAAFVVSTRAIPYSSVMVACLIFGGWANPLSYVFRAFGVNGFDGRRRDAANRSEHRGVEQLRHHRGVGAHSRRRVRLISARHRQSSVPQTPPRRAPT